MIKSGKIHLSLSGIVFGCFTEFLQYQDSGGLGMHRITENRRQGVAMAVVLTLMRYSSPEWAPGQGQAREHQRTRWGSPRAMCGFPLIIEMWIIAKHRALTVCCCILRWGSYERRRFRVQTPGKRELALGIIILTRLESTGTIPGIWTLVFMEFGLLLWTEDDSGLPTGPLTITKTLKTFFDNVLLEHVGLIRVVPLAVSFCAEQVEGVILSHFYSLGFIIRDLFHA